MRVFIAGATGVLGRRLVDRCAERGYEVIGLARDAAGEQLIRERGGKPYRGDVLDQEGLLAAVESADAIVNAVSKVPVDTDPDEDQWERNDRVRRAGTENLLSAAEAWGVDRFIQSSVVWVARQPDGSEFDEESPPNPDASVESAFDAEEMALEAAKEGDFDSVVLRCGYFYSPDAAHTRLFARRLIDGKLPIVGTGMTGRGDATLSFCHVDDAAAAYLAAIEGDATGRFHVVDDDPATFARFLEEFADRLGASSPTRVPASMAKFVVGENVLRLITESMPTTNEKFRNTFGWEPQYSTVEDGLTQAVEEWIGTGMLAESDDGYEWVGESTAAETAAD